MSISLSVYIFYSQAKYNTILSNSEGSYSAFVTYITIIIITQPYVSRNEAINWRHLITRQRYNSAVKDGYAVWYLEHNYNTAVKDGYAVWYLEHNYNTAVKDGYAVWYLEHNYNTAVKDGYAVLVLRN